MNLRAQHQIGLAVNHQRMAAIFRAQARYFTSGSLSSERNAAKHERQITEGVAHVISSSTFIRPVSGKTIRKPCYLPLGQA